MTTKTTRNKSKSHQQKVFCLRQDQAKAFDEIRKHRLAIINMPTGWGKSIVITGVCAADLANAERKTIVVVPQNVIAKGFKFKTVIQLPTGERVSWSAPGNLCSRRPRKIAQLVSFIRNRPAAQPEKRVVLATHKSLSAAFQKLKPGEVKSVFRNTTLCVDEAHHIHASEIGRNALGGVIGTLLEINDPTTKILMATAYFFRGDRLPIVTAQNFARFYRHHVPFDEYWGSLEHIQSYSYEFIVFKGTVWRELEHLLACSSEPTIIYCPFEGHKVLLGKTKASFTKRVVALCKRYLGAELWTPQAGSKVVIDFVDTAARHEKIRFVEKHPERVAAILTVGMFKEGADWVPAQRIIDLNPSGSDQDRMQRFGRLVRDYPGKTHISYYSFFPCVADEKEEDRRLALSKLYAHFHASLVLENAIRPIKVHVGSNRRNNDDGEPGRRSQCLNLLGTLDHPTQERVFKESYDSLIRIQDDRSRQGGSITAAEAREAIIDVLKSNGVKQHLDATAKQVLLVMRRKMNVSLSADELVKAGFDKVWAMEILDGLLAYSSAVGGPATLAEIRQVIDRVFISGWLEKFHEISRLPVAPDTQSPAYWWCTHNRVLHQAGRLTDEQVRLLESIVWWRWSETTDDRWRSKFDALWNEKACPRAGTAEYAWVRQQRRMYHQGTLSPERIALLKSISWWTWANNAKNWNTVFARISTLSSPPSAGSSDAEWCSTQKKRRRAGKLPSERENLLSAISWWAWEQNREDWDAMFASVRKLKNFPAFKSSEWRWCNNQRRRYRKGKLSPERVKKLESLSYWSWGRHAQPA